MGGWALPPQSRRMDHRNERLLVDLCCSVVHVSEHGYIDARRDGIEEKREKRMYAMNEYLLLVETPSSRDPLRNPGVVSWYCRMVRK